jgi:hypothetical protein
MRCERAARLISDSLDGALPGARKARLDAHLAGCPDCRSRRDGLLRLQAAARAFAPADSDAEQMARSLSRLKAAIRKEASSAPVRGRIGMGARWLPAGAAASLLATLAGLYLIFLRPVTVVDPVPYAYSDAGANLAVTLAEDEDLAQAFESVIGAELEENNGRFAAAVESRAIDTGHFLDSLTDDEVLILEAALGSEVAL